ncbi:hypothetical protein KIW84_075550 [Lathyrus oleraceus]|uniref:Uncharacterized protein n=1 Tax=Pisum sativum TaxID=3888 RepID=A0A9D4VX46_PEA|nr:hypothetical protein KIW84_075550 [Pisum sativum]
MGLQPSLTKVIDDPNDAWTSLLPQSSKFWKMRIPESVVIRYDGSKQKVSPALVIKPAGPVPYSFDKAIPFRYNAVAVEDGKEVPLPSPSVVNIADLRLAACAR